MPYKTAVGTTYDSGDFAPILDKALALAALRRASRSAAASRSKKRGKLRGIGISCYPRASRAASRPKARRCCFPAASKLVLGIGVQTTGQGHATIYPRLVAAQARHPGARRSRTATATPTCDLQGNPSVGSRSTMTVGGALYRAADLMLEKAKRGRRRAAAKPPKPMSTYATAISVSSAPTGVSRCSRLRRAPKRDGLTESLDTKATVDTPPTFPNGCHIAEVEIDPETGAIEIVAYAAVDDGGDVLDDTIVEGQLTAASRRGSARR